MGGQALILASRLFKTPIEGDLKVLTERNDSKRLAEHAIEFINGMDSLADIYLLNLISFMLFY